MKTYTEREMQDLYRRVDESGTHMYIDGELRMKPINHQIAGQRISPGLERIRKQKMPKMTVKSLPWRGSLPNIERSFNASWQEEENKIIHDRLKSLNKT